MCAEGSVKGDRRRTRHEQEPGRDALRHAVLAAAAQLPAEEGAAALTVRRLADAVERSTMVVYTLFG